MEQARQLADVSIHAPAWGATPRALAASAGSWWFQSTHPRGVRLVKTAQDSLFLTVSIHAPAWGATWYAAGDGVPYLVFQSTHPRGVRRLPRGRGLGQWAGFNPRTRVGCDSSRSSWATGHCSFNPRTRVGCDVDHAGLRPAGGQVSIHAPAWGATMSACASASVSLRFQSTHPRGVRRAQHEGVRQLDAGFNPRTRVGCDPGQPSDPYAQCQFQSTHPRGVRRQITAQVIVIKCVSVHAPAWGATILMKTTSS